MIFVYIDVWNRSYPFPSLRRSLPSKLIQINKAAGRSTVQTSVLKEKRNKKRLIFFCPLACACNNLGSLSAFCRSRDGQCQCRRNFQGQKCNDYRIGFYDFPSCKACNCNPAGIKLLPGQTNSCGSVNIVRYNISRKVESSPKQNAILGITVAQHNFQRNLRSLEIAVKHSLIYLLITIYAIIISCLCLMRPLP